MTRTRQITSQSLTLQMQNQGIATAQQLADGLRVDRSTVSRVLSGLGDSVIRIGAARRARYALRRDVRSRGTAWPLYRIDVDGLAEEWANVHAFHGGFRVDFISAAPAWLERGYRDGIFPGLPFFLIDIRPQGFLGRALARDFGSPNGLPEDPRAWQDDDILSALLAAGHDLPGDLVLGERAMWAVIQGRNASRGMALDERVNRYPGRADQAMQGHTPGSSAGGEQPKFLAAVRTDDGTVRDVLVKFSPPMDTPGGRRWADLLVAEHHALAVLAAHGDEVAATGLLEAGTRRFLEVTRFDRFGAHGRRGVLTLQAIEAGLLDETVTDWPSAASAMRAGGLLSAADATTLIHRWCFGRQIANNDMHFGNAAVWFGDDEPFPLAPAYDMLPMLFAPSAQGEVVPREFNPSPPLPQWREAWQTVTPWALEFWQRVEADETISTEFRQLAAQAGRRVAEVAAQERRV